MNNNMKKENLIKRLLTKIRYSRLVSELRVRRQLKKSIKEEYKRLDRECMLAMTNDEDDNKCVQEAVKCYKAISKLMIKKAYNGFGLSIVANTVRKLLDGFPLSSITDEDFVDEEYQSEDDYTVQLCNRMPGLFRYKNKETGEISEYQYVYRTRVIDESTGFVFFWSFYEKKLEELGLIKKIELPYCIPDKPYRIYVLSDMEDISENEIVCYTYLDYFIDENDKTIKVDRLYKGITYEDAEEKEIYSEVIDKEEKKRIVKRLKSNLKKGNK